MWFNPTLSGPLSLYAVFEGTGANPIITADFEGTIRDISTKKISKKKHGARLLTCKGTLRQQADVACVKIQGESGKTSKALIEGTIKWPMTLDMHATVQGDLETLNIFVLPNDRLTGVVDGKLRITGTFLAPLLNGVISLKKGVFEDHTRGGIINDIGLTVDIKQSHGTINNCTGNDSMSGKLTCKGQLIFGSWFLPKMDLHVDFLSFLVANRDALTAKATGKIGLFLDPITGLLIKGNINLDKTDYALEEATPQSKMFKVLESQDLPLDSQKHFTYKGRKIADFDIRLRAPGQLFIYGFGLDAEWAGDLHVQGPNIDPHITGRLTIKKGDLKIASKKLSVKKGKLIFSGKNTIPQLSLIAGKKIAGYDTFLRFDGDVTAPEISYGANPSLSPEEALSLILFGKTLNQTSKAQSVQLALVISAIKDSKGLTVPEKLGQLFGFDYVSVEETRSSDQDTDPGYKVRLGRQLTDRISLSLDQGVDRSTGTSANISVRITDQTTIDLNVGTGERNNSVSYNWEKKY